MAAPASPGRSFLGVERSLTGRRWVDRLGDVTAANALAIAQRHAIPDIVARVVAAARGPNVLDAVWKSLVYAIFTRVRSLFSWRLLDLLYASRCPDPLRENTKMDFIYLVGIAIFLGLCVALTAGCDKLRNRGPGGRP